jgi:hypothetical protein
MKDLKAYREIAGFAEHNSNIMMGFYPQKINEFMDVFVTVDSVPKTQKYKSFFGDSLKERSIPAMIGDCLKFAKLGGGIIIQ